MVWGGRSTEASEEIDAVAEKITALAKGRPKLDGPDILAELRARLESSDAPRLETRLRSFFELKSGNLLKLLVEAFGDFHKPREAKFGFFILDSEGGIVVES